LNEKQRNHSKRAIIDSTELAHAQPQKWARMQMIKSGTEKAGCIDNLKSSSAETARRQGQAKPTIAPWEWSN